MQRHGRFLQAATGFAARATHAPAGAIAQLVVAHKVDFCPAFTGATAQQGARVLRGHGFGAHVGQYAGAAPQPLQAWRGVVQGQAQGVEQGALAGAHGAGYGKQAC